jgi:quaternary ammonium compound-resistance protein SugE
MQSWVYLLAASGAEVVMAYALKQSAAWSKPLPSLVAVLAALLSIFLLAHALRGLPLGTAYVVWTGLGAAGVLLAGVLLYGEALTPLRMLLLALVIAGTAGLKAT